MFAKKETLYGNIVVNSLRLQTVHNKGNN